MRLGRPVEPDWVSRILAPLKVERTLAFLTAALLLAAAVGVELGLVRELRLGRAPSWALVGAMAAVVVLAWIYARWLAPRLRRPERPRWRLAPREAHRLLPPPFIAFWTAGGFASYSSPWDWAMSAWGGAFLGGLVLPALLSRLDRRVAAEVQGPATAAS